MYSGTFALEDVTQPGEHHTSALGAIWQREAFENTLK